MSQAKIDGQYFSWAEMQIAFGIINGPTFQTDDIAGLDFGDKLTPGVFRGAGALKRGRTMGEHDADGQMILALDAATVFMNQLKAQSRHPQKRIGGVVFNISAAWMPLDGGGTVREAKLIGCRIVERQFTNAPGPDPSIVTFPLDLMDLDVDGTKL